MLFLYVCEVLVVSVYRIHLNSLRAQADFWLQSVAVFVETIQNITKYIVPGVFA